MFKETYKNMNEKITPSDYLIKTTTETIESGKSVPVKKINYKLTAIAAVICISILFAIPAVGANTPITYDILYAVAPQTAQFFRSVNMSCVDNGIEMSVIATYIHENTAEIYIQMRDLEGDRIDETTDLFDSYDINRPFDGYGHCEKVSYDENEKAVTFLITVTETENEKIRSKKMTFSVDKFLSHKNSEKLTLSELDLSTADRNPKMKKNVEVVGISGKYMKEYEKYNFTGMENIPVLDIETPMLSPVNGIDIMGIGYIDGKLHLQIRHKDVRTTDNHAIIQLTDKSGNPLECESSLTFFGEKRKDHYYEYVYEVPYEDLGNYTLSGEFITCDTLIEGKWKVTFPLENNS